MLSLSLLSAVGQLDLQSDHLATAMTAMTPMRFRSDCVINVEMTYLLFLVLDLSLRAINGIGRLDLKGVMVLPVNVRVVWLCHNRRSTLAETSCTRNTTIPVPFALPSVADKVRSMHGICATTNVHIFICPCALLNND